MELEEERAGQIVAEAAMFQVAFYDAAGIQGAHFHTELGCPEGLPFNMHAARAFLSQVLARAAIQSTCRLQLLITHFASSPFLQFELYNHPYDFNQYFPYSSL
jgi:hypothetical protein